MARLTTISGLLGLIFAIGQVAAHGHLSVPANRGYSHRQDENNAPVAYPLANDFICRNDPATPSSMWATLTAGQTTATQWAMEAAHPGDCFLYLSYDADLPDAQKKWFKIAQFDKCNMQNLQNMTYTVPSYLPSSNHAILRWEWYALHLRDINIIEFYAQCADVKIIGAASGQLPTPQVTIPGHLPMSANFYRSDYKQPQLTLFTGPPIASIGGAAYNCTTAYDNSCVVEPATNNPCTISHQRCVSETQYQSCGIGATTTEWAAYQTCQTGLVCLPHSDGAHIMCSYKTADYVAPTLTPSGTPSTQAPATQAPATQAPTQAPATQAPAPTQAPTQIPTNSPSGTVACTVGAMKCNGASTYQSCIGGRDGANFWAATQSCQTSLFCNQQDKVVYCGRTQTFFDSPVTQAPATQAPATQAPVTQAPATQAPATQTPSSGACTFGYQQCTGSGTYKTCVQTNTWSADQSCQTGLTCHQSSTANNIYCY